MATVEFAVIAPLFLTLLLGSVEMGRALDFATRLTSAVREGGRLAAMDLGGLELNGATANEKVVQDIKNMLAASGLSPDDVTISITHAEGPNEGDEFDLTDRDNYLELFRISAELDYSTVAVTPLHHRAGRNIVSSLVFRKGRSRLTN